MTNVTCFTPANRFAVESIRAIRLTIFINRIFTFFSTCVTSFLFTFVCATGSEILTGIFSTVCFFETFRFKILRKTRTRCISQSSTWLKYSTEQRDFDCSYNNRQFRLQIRFFRKIGKFFKKFSGSKLKFAWNFH